MTKEKNQTQANTTLHLTPDEIRVLKLQSSLVPKPGGIISDIVSTLFVLMILMITVLAVIPIYGYAIGIMDAGATILISVPMFLAVIGIWYVAYGNHPYNQSRLDKARYSLKQKIKAAEERPFKGGRYA